MKSDRDIAIEYKWFPIMTRYPWCWSCGYDRPQAGWSGAWNVDRAHIVNKPRACDRRAVILLCSLCHGRSHGMVYPPSIVLHDIPSLSVANMLWLKRNFDPEFFDREFLQSKSIGRLPRLHIPRPIIRQIYQSKRGDYGGWRDPRKENCS